MKKHYEKKAKKIWIDLENSPHVPFSYPIIKELENRGYQVVVTARDYAQVYGLADIFNIKCKRIGRHYGKNKILKVAGLLIRTLQLMPFFLTEKPDLAFSHGSRSLLLTASLTRLPSVMALDYEYTQGLPFVHPTLSIMPMVLYEKFIKEDTKGISYYPGIKEDVYVRHFEPDPGILKYLGVNDGEVVATIRPPATAAHYHNSETDELFTEIIKYLSGKQDIRIIITPRTPDQDAEIRKRWPECFDNGKIIIPAQVVNGLNLIWHSDLVISGGGTMIREAAALDVPAYSFFRGKIGAVDQYLSETARLTLISSTEDIHTKIVTDKWCRPARPENTKRPALQSIVDSMVAMLKAD